MFFVSSVPKNKKEPENLCNIARFFGFIIIKKALSVDNTFPIPEVKSPVGYSLKDFTATLVCARPKFLLVKHLDPSIKHLTHLCSNVSYTN